jgi:hypothetical protein
MYVNGKMITTETIPRIGVGIKDDGEGGEFKYDTFDIL